MELKEGNSINMTEDRKSVVSRIELEDKFIKRFGRHNLESLIKAADEHKGQGWGVNGGESQRFIWACLVAIDFQCVEIKAYADYHEIDIEYTDFINFIKENIQDFRDYKGEPTTYAGLLGGAFNFLLEDD